jgi:hypothetical protein
VDRLCSWEVKLNLHAEFVYEAKSQFTDHCNEEWHRPTVGVVWVLGKRVAKEQRLVESLGLGKLDSLHAAISVCRRRLGTPCGGTYRSRGAEILRERLAGLHGGERTRPASVVRDGVHVDGRVAVVDNDGLLGRAQAENGGDGEDGNLHDENE